MKWPWVSRRFYDDAMRIRRRHYSELESKLEDSERFATKLQSQVNAADAKLSKVNYVVDDARRQVTLHGSDPVVRLDDIEPLLL